MSDLPTIPSPPLDLSEFKDVPPEQLREKQLKLIELAVSREDPLDKAIFTTVAKTLKIDKGDFNAAIKARKKEIDSANFHKFQEAKALEITKKTAFDGEDPIVCEDGDKYYRKENDGRYGKLKRLDVVMHLKILGLSAKEGDDTSSPVERKLQEIQMTNRVAFAGPLCGRPPGIHEANGMRVLCTAGPEIINGVEGKFPLIEKMVRNLFGAHAEDPHAQQQFDIFTLWLKRGRLALRNWSQHLPGHVLILAGRPDCGKSLFQKVIITPSLGGRVADPGLWFDGKSSFNNNLWAAEHIAVGDKALPKDHASRERMRETLKELVANTEYVFHPKGESQQTFRHIWRVSITSNDDEASIQNLPSTQGGFHDKVIILRGYPPESLFWESSDSEGQSKFEAKIKAELPAFLHFVDNFEAPERLAKGRFGVIEWHHPYILASINEGDPKQYLSETIQEWARGVIDADLKWKAKGYVDITTKDLYSQLDGGYDVYKFKMAFGPQNLGTQLKTIMLRPEWVGKMVEKKSGIKRWRIWGSPKPQEDFEG